ncbi:kinase-like protein, partial [Backusella circina FSU 941]
LVNLSQFKILNTLGKGGFGKVYKVQHNTRHKLYALKVIDKNKCILMDAVPNIIRERTILEKLDHPLVCNMRFAFQDNSSIYMAMDLMSAGDLRFHLKKQHHSEITLRFWIAELICAVKYLHSQGIIHRKKTPPPQIGFSSQVHVTTSRPVTSVKAKRTMTPEMFRGGGYTEDVDWWSVGVTFYECVFGTRPWIQCGTIDELSKQVVHGSISYPESDEFSPECISAIQCFLEQDPERRLGHGIMSGWHQIMRHPFFHSIDWYGIDNKECLPVYVPEAPDTVQEQQDQHTITRDEPDMFGWLYRRQSRRASHISPERYNNDLDTLQRKFKPFDYTIFDQYEGFLDERLMTVGPPPDWVKPAFPGADNGSLLPIRKVYLEQTPHVFDIFEYQENRNWLQWPAEQHCT